MTRRFMCEFVAFVYLVGLSAAFLAMVAAWR